MSYIIVNDELVAKTSAFISEGSIVRWSHNKIKNNDDTSPTRPYSLVGAELGTISNHRKWDHESRRTMVTTCIDSSGQYLDFYCYSTKETK